LFQYYFRGEGLAAVRDWERGTSWDGLDMSEADESPVTEPVTVNDMFLTGILVELISDCVRITGYSHLSKRSGEMDERRVVARTMLPPAVGRDLLAQLRRIYAKGGH
jgi:hypothetical protein